MVSLQLIKLDNHYHLLDNGIPTSYYYDDFVKNIRSTNGAVYSKSDHIFPIVASTRKLGVGEMQIPSIDFNQINLLLSSDKLNDIEKLAELKYEKININTEAESGFMQIHQIHKEENNFYKREGFVEGYKQAINNNNSKLFTASDMIDFACRVYDENYKKDMSFKKKAEEMVKTYNSCEIEPLKKYFAQIEMEWKPIAGHSCEECRTGFQHFKKDGCDNICKYHIPKVNDKGFINILKITAQ